MVVSRTRWVVVVTAATLGLVGLGAFLYVRQQKCKQGKTGSNDEDDQVDAEAATESVRREQDEVQFEDVTLS
ncbi:MAG: hypothetical protein MHM6MM_008352, partial [Cercozoa sp. M6MM]